MEVGKPSAEIESIIKTLEAHSGAAGFFNRIGFSGLSLGTIASAFLILLLGLISVKFDIISSSQFDAFVDLAKLLFGAFMGSFASRPQTPAKQGKLVH